MKKYVIVGFLFLLSSYCKAICSEKDSSLEIPLISINALKSNLLIKIGEPLTHKNCSLSPTACADIVVKSDILFAKYLEYNRKYITGDDPKKIIDSSIQADFKDKAIEQPIAELMVSLELQNHEVDL